MPKESPRSLETSDSSALTRRRIALSSIARGGSITLLGLPPHGTEVAIVPDDFVVNDITLPGSVSCTRSARSAVVALLNDGALAPSFLISHSAFSISNSPWRHWGIRHRRSARQGNGRTARLDPPFGLQEAASMAMTSCSDHAPGARRSVASWLASICSSSLTGVATP